MIGLVQLMEAFEYKKKSDLWFYDQCAIDERGIRAKPITDEDGNRLVLTKEELEIINDEGNKLRLDFPCTIVELIDWCKRNDWSDKLLLSNFVEKKSPSIFYNAIEREKLDARILKNGPSTTSISHFVDFILTDAIGGGYGAIETFYQLIEKDSLIVHDKVINGKPVDTKSLISSLKKREQQADDAFGDDKFQFWEGIEKEYKYHIYRENVAVAYKNAGQLKFPWVKWNNEFVWLNYPFNNSNGMKEKLRRKDNLPKEPTALNLVYKPEKKHKLEKSFKQQKWDEIPTINQEHWKHKDTLTIIELAFILKEKEPQKKITLSIINSNYPEYFFTFCSKLSDLVDSSMDVGKLKELYPPQLYMEEWADTPTFNKYLLTKWAISKEYEIPSWLVTDPLIGEKNSEIDSVDSGLELVNKANDLKNEKTVDAIQKKLMQYKEGQLPSCGNKYNHKLIDRAFYSTDKPLSEIKKPDILTAIIQDHKFPERERVIDVEDRVLRIERGYVYWEPTSDNDEAKITPSNITKLLKKLQQ